MNIDVDHIFICVRSGAPEAEALKAMGLTEGLPNKHPGQGTANRRFFFHNIFIELLWLDDAAEAQSELTRPTMLYERLAASNDETSPFGICFRPAALGGNKAPFPSWNYKPVYLPSNFEVEIASDIPLSEPMWFFLSFASRPDSAPQERRQPFVHQTGFMEVTSLRIVLPKIKSLSVAARSIIQSEYLSIVEGEHHLFEMGFDHETQGRSHDFRPLLPLLFKW